jgi:hypothetical protein
VNTSRHFLIPYLFLFLGSGATKASGITRGPGTPYRRRILWCIHGAARLWKCCKATRTELSVWKVRLEIGESMRTRTRIGQPQRRADAVGSALRADTGSTAGSCSRRRVRPGAGTLRHPEFHRPRDIGQVADDLPVDLPPLWTNLDGAISLDRYAETVPHKPRDGPPTWRRGGGALLPARFARPLHSGGAGSGSNRWTESPTRSASCTRNSAMTVSFSFMTC